MVTFATDDGDCRLPQMPDPGFCRGLDPLCKCPASSCFSCVTCGQVFRAAPSPPGAISPCLRGGNTPLKSWPRWARAISFGRADNAQPVPSCASQNHERGHGFRRELGCPERGEEFMPDPTVIHRIPESALSIDRNFDSPR